MATCLSLSLPRARRAAGKLSRSLLRWSLSVPKSPLTGCRSLSRLLWHRRLSVTKSPLTGCKSLSRLLTTASWCGRKWKNTFTTLTERADTLKVPGLCEVHAFHKLCLLLCQLLLGDGLF